jgi:LacI family transcriptional regulator
MKTKVTILDLEKKSGVSKTTISRYLRGMIVSQDKALRIEKAIAECGFIRNNFAQLLRTSESNLIAVLIPDMDNPFFLKIIKRLEELALTKGKTLIIKTTQRSQTTELKTIEFVRGFLVEALFLCRSELDDDILDALKIDIPVISLDREFKNTTSIVSNNYESAYDLSRHLIEHVDQNVMFFSRLHESNSVHERVRGFLDACKDTNKNGYLYKYDINLAINFYDIYDYVVKNEIDGIICRNDNEAVKILAFFNDLANKGKIRPIKVAGFDNIALSKFMIPKLTTVDQKVEEMCDIAFDLFVKNDCSPPRTIIHEGELIIRESTM